jgi:hypothetical protein
MPRRQHTQYIVPGKRGGYQLALPCPQLLFAEQMQDSALLRITETLRVHQRASSCLTCGVKSTFLLAIYGISG